MNKADRYLFDNMSKLSSNLSRREPTPVKVDQQVQSAQRSKNQSPLSMGRRKSTTPTRTRETSPFDNKFYNRIYLKDEQQKIRGQTKLKEIQEMSESKKMSQNSYRILCKQLEEKLALEIQKLDMRETRLLSFESIGRLLTVFNIIQSIQYNEICECTFLLEYSWNIMFLFKQLIRKYSIVKMNMLFQNEMKRYNQQDPSRYLKQSKKLLNLTARFIFKIKQMEFHEQLWMILGNYEHGVECISTDFAFSVIRLLLDPVQLKVDQLEALFSHYFLKQFPDMNQKRQNYSRVLDPNSYLPWTIKQFIQKYRKLTMTNISKVQHPTQSPTPQNAFTFKPEINEKSRILDDLNKSKLNVDNLLFSKEDHDTSSNSRMRTPDRIAIMNQKHEMKLLKIREQQDLTKDNEMKYCTFHPQTNVSRKTSKSPSRSQSEKSMESDHSERVFDRLYSQRNLIQDREEAERRQREIIFEMEKQQLKECSFRPQLTPYSPTRSKSPQGFHKNVGRMRMGYQKNVEQQQKLEHLNHININSSKPAGEKYEKVQKQKFNPPEMLNRSEIRHKPFIVLDINITAGKSGRLGICEGDNSVTLAKNFSKAFQLDQDMEETVLEIVQQQLDAYENKKRHLLKSVKSSTIQTQSQYIPSKTRNVRNEDEDDEEGSSHYSYASYS